MAKHRQKVKIRSRQKVLKVVKHTSLTHELSEEKSAKFDWVDHLWPHKAGDCAVSLKGLSQYFFNPFVIVS